MLLKYFTRLLSGISSSRKLLCFNAFNSYVLSALGDFCEQKIEISAKELDKWDGKRNRHMAQAGCLVGVMCHYWYDLLEDKFSSNFTIRNVLKIILADIAIFAPISAFIFIGTFALLERQDMEEFQEELGENLLVLFGGEVFSWIPSQLISFYLFRPQFRVLVDNIIVLFYDIYMSYMLNCHTNKDCLLFSKTQNEAKQVKNE